jgi:hypothetical protein
LVFETVKGAAPAGVAVPATTIAAPGRSSAAVAMVAESRRLPECRRGIAPPLLARLRLVGGEPSRWVRMAG